MGAYHFTSVLTRLGWIYTVMWAYGLQGNRCETRKWIVQVLYMIVMLCNTVGYKVLAPMLHPTFIFEAVVSTGVGPSNT